jgi:hypothetical protein
LKVYILAPKIEDFLIKPFKLRTIWQKMLISHPKNYFIFIFAFIFFTCKNQVLLLPIASIYVPKQVAIRAVILNNRFYLYLYLNSIFGNF